MVADAGRGGADLAIAAWWPTDDLGAIEGAGATGAGGRNRQARLPHMFRHSCATVLAADMPESELRIHFGWSPTSPMVYRYTRSDLADRAIARHRRNAPGDRIRP